MADFTLSTRQGVTDAKTVTFTVTGETDLADWTVEFYRKVNGAWQLDAYYNGSPGDADGLAHISGMQMRLLLDDSYTTTLAVGSHEVHFVLTNPDTSEPTAELAGLLTVTEGATA